MLKFVKSVLRKRKKSGYQLFEKLYDHVVIEDKLITNKNFKFQIKQRKTISHKFNYFTSQRLFKRLLKGKDENDIEFAFMGKNNLK